MAVELSQAKGSLKATAHELGITPQILTRWRAQRVASQVPLMGSRAQLSQEPQDDYHHGFVRWESDGLGLE